MSDAFAIGTLLASASRTATATSDQVVNTSGTGLMLFIDFTTSPNNAETLTPAIEVKDPATGKWMAITTFTALVSSAIGASPTTQTYIYTLYPSGAETVATAQHEVQALPLPRVWRVKLTHSSTTAWVYTVGYAELP